MSCISFESLPTNVCPGRSRWISPHNNRRPTINSLKSNTSQKLSIKFEIFWNSHDIKSRLYAGIGQEPMTKVESVLSDLYNNVKAYYQTSISQNVNQKTPLMEAFSFKTISVSDAIILDVSVGSFDSMKCQIRFLTAWFQSLSRKKNSILPIDMSKNTCFTKSLITCIVCDKLKELSKLRLELLKWYSVPNFKLKFSNPCKYFLLLLGLFSAAYLFEIPVLQLFEIFWVFRTVILKNKIVYVSTSDDYKLFEA